MSQITRETYDENGNIIKTEILDVDDRILTLQKIRLLEATITERRRDEAILGQDNGWLANVRAEIAILRAKL